MTGDARKSKPDLDLTSDDAEAPVPAEQHLAYEFDDKLSAFDNTAKKVRLFPQTPGVYLMKDSAGVVIYVGKATNLRSRAGSYFLKAAKAEQRTADWIGEIADIDCIICESEVDALLVESRLIKDIQPRHNKILKDDKTFPYLQITTHEDFPRVEITREPSNTGVKLYGPFASAGSLRGAIQVLQRIFKFRTCSLDITDGDEQWRWFQALPPSQHQSMHGTLQSSHLQRGVQKRYQTFALVFSRQQKTLT